MVLAVPSLAIAQPSRTVGSASPVPAIRLALSSPEPGMTYQVIPEPDPAPRLKCPQGCELTLLPGRYRLEAVPPDGQGLRTVEYPLDLRQDTTVRVTPGSKAAHGWGLGLTIGGAVVFGFGGLMFYGGRMTTGSGQEPWQVATMTALLAVGAGTLAGGIYLLAIGRNRIVVTPTGGETQPVATGYPSGLSLGVSREF